MKRTWDKLIVEDKVRVKPLKSETVWLVSPILPDKTLQGKTVQNTVELLDCGKRGKKTEAAVWCSAKTKNGDEKEKTAHVQSVQNFLNHLVREWGRTDAHSLRSVFMSDTRPEVWQQWWKHRKDCARVDKEQLRKCVCPWYCRICLYLWGQHAVCSKAWNKLKIIHCPLRSAVM